MGSRERRTRQLHETRDRILDAARDLLVQRGYEATTMRAIADQIEYTPTAIYHHFENKEALVAELATADFRALAGAFRRIGRIEDPVERLRRVGEAYVAFALEHPMQYQFLFMTRRPGVARGGEAADADPSEHAYGFVRATCAAAIASGRLRPAFADAEQLAQITWSSLHGLLALHIVKHEGAGWVQWRDPRATAAAIADALFFGIVRERPA